MMKLRRLVFLVVLWGCAKQTPYPKLYVYPDTVRVFIGGTKVVLEVAADEQSVRRGLMFRDSLAQNSGMLFVFPYERIYPFWMKNTSIPLSIAFIDSDGRVVGIAQMQPFDTLTRHAPSKPYLYAIEMNRGWFKAHGVQVGDTISLPRLQD